MKRTSLAVTGFKGPVIVIHNPDWSGDVTVEYGPADEIRHVTLPAAIFLAAGKQIALTVLHRDVKGFLDNL